jgi:anti-sigma B factor antagonist
MVTASSRLELDNVGKVTILSFRDERIVNDDVIQEICEEFRGLVTQRGRRNIVLNFSRVKAISAAAISALLFLKKRVETTQGQLRLCCIHPELREIFHLHRPKKSPPLFQIFEEEQGALDSF